LCNESPCILLSCNLIRLRSAQHTASYQIHPSCLDTLSHIVDTVTAPAESSSAAPSDEEEEEEGESTALDLPGRSQAVTALETLQRYLLGVSDSDEAQISFPSVEQFIISKRGCTTQITMDYFFAMFL